METNLRQDKGILLTGIKPTGRPHLGNYLGMIRPALELAFDHQAYFFIADGHALTANRHPEWLPDRVYDIAATWLALGLKPEQTVFYRQSAVPEIFTLSWILACSTPKGLLNRAHAYKAAVVGNEAAGHDPDADINAGLFTYPVLMAADILIMRADRVPVGEDQRQHLEAARDIAGAFNHTYGPVFNLPDAVINPSVKTIPGLDGRKMSKSYGNAIPIFCGVDELRPLIMRIVTDSRRPEEPKDPEQCNVFALYRLFAPLADVSRMRQRYLDGGLAYREIKEELVAVLTTRFDSAARHYKELRADREGLARLLADGAARARQRARSTLDDVRSAVGIAS